MLLAGDIGGTKTVLATFSPQEGPHNPMTQATYPSGDYPDLAAIVRRFLEETGVQVDRATFGVAGPVVAGRATITNLPWVLEEKALQEALGLTSVRLLNDLQSIANSVPILEAGDLQTLNPGEPQAGGAIAVIAPGTGLGEAYLTWDGSRYRAHASEGGHTDFGPLNEREHGLLCFLQQRYDHVSYERICSGSGLPNIYAYLVESGAHEEPAWLREQVQAADDPTPIIVNAAQEKACPLCLATLHTFVSILGAEAGNLALKVLATGGVYLGGGIPPRILPTLQQGPFMRAFGAKGRMSDLAARMPVHVILHPQAALLGAARSGLTQEKNH